MVRKKVEKKMVKENVKKWYSTVGDSDEIKYKV